MSASYPKQLAAESYSLFSQIYIMYINKYRQTDRQTDRLTERPTD